MRPEIIVMAAYWAFGIWMYLMGARAKRGEIKTDGAHVISVYPLNRTNMDIYNAVYTKFHNRLFIVSLLMGILCGLIGGLLPIIFSSLAFFASLNFYKYKTEEKLSDIVSNRKAG
ncbi:hypothetical protein [Fusibacter sp. JL216-2]|uniref:hypothetical protein n=1 Tax=Fusibacter sp. JL216-2 TaxID=3071453 RepID=UPI003D34521C